MPCSAQKPTRFLLFCKCLRLGHRAVLLLGCQGLEGLLQLWELEAPQLQQQSLLALWAVRPGLGPAKQVKRRVQDRSLLHAAHLQNSKGQNGTEGSLWP